MQRFSGVAERNNMIKISSILIGVNNLEKAKPFYEKVFGFVFDEFRPPFASATLDDVEFNIEENAPVRDKDWSTRNIGTRKNVSFETDDLNNFLKVVTDNGGKVIKVPTDTPWNWRESIIADPDGNEFLIEQNCEK